METPEQYQYSQNTPIKQVSLHLALDLHIQLCLQIFEKWKYKTKPVYYHFDLHGGPGVDPDGNPGSPLIFYHLAKKYDLPFRSQVFELDREQYQSLRYVTRHIPGMRVYNCDHRELLKALPLRKEYWRYGVAYCDPSNAVIPVDVLQGIERAYPKVVFMINLAAASYKRGLNLPTYIQLSELLKSLKPHWIIRKPIDKFQWTLLIGTAWKAFPAWPTREFESLDSPAGEKWWEDICYTHKERQALYQPSLFKDW